MQTMLNGGHMPDWSASEDLNDVWGNIARLGLEPNVAQLEAYGFTYIEGVLDADTLTTARQAILDLAEAQTGVKPNLDTGEGHDNLRLIPYLMPRHPIFQDVLMNEKMLALVTYLVGKQCQLSSMTCHFKGMGRGGEIGLHTDTGMPAPLPRYSQVATVNYAMVDYTKESGALAIVPESHKRARNPKPLESRLAGANENPDAIPVEMPAGSMAIWHGNTWHGSYPRMVPGLRLNLAVYFARPWMKLQERYGAELDPEVVARHGNNPRFRQLVGLNEYYGWKEEGPNFMDPKENNAIFTDELNDDEKSELANKALRRGDSWHA